MSTGQGFGSTLDDLAVVCASPDGFTIDELHIRLAERTWPLLLVLFSLPFTTPIPLPGISSLFGIGIAAIGFAQMLGKTPVLPARVRRIRCSPGFLARVVAGTARLLARLRSVLKPRWIWLAEHRALRIVSGCIIGISGLLLALPLPIPFSNAIPAYVILLTSIGLIERDGLIILVGQVVFMSCITFFAVILWGVVSGVRALAS